MHSEPAPRNPAIGSRSPRRPAATTAAAVDRAGILALRSEIGNRGVCDVLAQRAVVQAKLRVGPAGDRYEREADEIADEVMRAPSGHVEVSRAGSHLGRSVRTDATGPQGGTLAAEPAAAINRERGQGASLPAPLRESMERSLAADLRGVRIHTGSSADALSRSMQARAFTTGADIFFADGQYQPQTRAGRRLLAHELTHTIQQGAAGDLSSSPPTSTADTVAQRVRGGLEFTEDPPAILNSYATPPAPGGGGVARSERWDISGSIVSAFVVAPADPVWGGQRNQDFTLLDSAPVELTNDVNQAEWVIKRHGADVTPDAMKTNLAADITKLFEMRSKLALKVAALASRNPGMFIALVPGDVDPLDTGADPEGVFFYRAGTSKGKAQITVQYTKEETLRRINLLNASKFLTGTKVAEGEDVSRIAGTESTALKRADLAGQTSFSNAAGLLTQLIAASTEIRDAGTNALVLNVHQVGLIKLMVLNDAVATTMVRYAAQLGQGQEKNLQRLFPKSRRDEYSKAVAGAAISPANMLLLRTEILNTAAADAALLYAAADAGALRVDEAFNALGPGHANMATMLQARNQLQGVLPGVPTPADINMIKSAVLGANGALVVPRVQEAARAYTDTSVAGTDQWVGGAGPGGGASSRVIAPTRGFTPVAGAAPGAIYEFREREIAAEEPRWYKIGSVADLKDALEKMFEASS
jgi:hypothetical protein